MVYYTTLEDRSPFWAH